MVQLTSPIRKNPNATVGAGGGFLAVFITWLAGNVLHWNVSAEGGAIIATAVSTVVLLIGREGIKGLIDIVWNGTRRRDHSDQAAPTTR